MAKKPACPQCGASNAADARRCRLCATLLNIEIPETAYQPKGIPEHIERQMHRDWQGDPNATEQTVIPGGSFGSLPPIGPDAPIGDGPPAPDVAAVASAPPPPPRYEPAPHDVPTASHAYDAAPYADAPMPADGDSFDPDELFRQMKADPSPMATVPFGSTPELEPDPLWSLGGDGREMTSEEIERITAEALREERLRKRSGLLDKVFQTEQAAGEDDELDADAPAPPPPPPAAAAPADLGSLPPPPGAAPPPPADLGALPPPPVAPPPPGVESLPPPPSAPPPPAAPLPPPPAAAPLPPPPAAAPLPPPPPAAPPPPPPAADLGSLPPPPPPPPAAAPPPPAPPVDAPPAAIDLLPPPSPESANDTGQAPPASPTTGATPF